MLVCSSSAVSRAEIAAESLLDVAFCETRDVADMKWTLDVEQIEVETWNI